MLLNHLMFLRLFRGVFWISKKGKIIYLFDFEFRIFQQFCFFNIFPPNMDSISSLEYSLKSEGLLT